jgi:aminoglycoside phosphotransferase (APT) family kinase protein
LASGRAADVYDLGDGTVLRRYRTDAHDLGYEVRVMRLVADAGIPVPAVVSWSGRDLVMGRLDGPTMLADLGERPARLLFHARTLARLQRALAEVPAPDWMLATGVAPGNDSVLHLDLHPMNVMITDGGPVIIDWSNAAGGPAGFDAALSYVAMATYEVDSSPDRAAQRAFVSLFLRFRGGRRMIDPYLAAACDHRLADPHLTPAERVNVAALRKRAKARRAPQR